MIEKYICDFCKKECEVDRAEWTEEQQKAEMKQYFGNLSKEDCARICDDCFQQMHPEKYPHLVEEAVMKEKKRKMINIVNQTIDQAGPGGIEPILKWEVWFSCPLGVTRSLSEAKEAAGLVEVNALLVISPVCVAISETMTEVYRVG